MILQGGELRPPDEAAKKKIIDQHLETRLEKQNIRTQRISQSVGRESYLVEGNSTKIQTRGTDT